MKRQNLKGKKVTKTVKVRKSATSEVSTILIAPQIG